MTVTFAYFVINGFKSSILMATKVPMVTKVPIATKAPMATKSSCDGHFNGN